MEKWLDDEEVEMIKEYLTGESSLNIAELFFWDKSPDGEDYWMEQEELEMNTGTISDHAQSNLKQYLEQHEK